MRRETVAAALLCSVAGTALLAGQAQAQETDRDVIIVTAQKREQSLQDVPISETVLSTEQLDRLQIDTGTEIARQTPNLRVSVLGNEDQPKFSMRGISTAEFNLNATSATGIFYDEVYVASSFLGGPQMFDMERVEVLRGPQGTLFGKNTTGGAVNFITRLPDFEAGGYVTAEYGENDYKHVAGAYETPLIEDRLAVRAAFNYTDSDGWQENENPAGNDLSSIESYAGRVTLAYKGDDFDANLRVFSSRSYPTAIGAISYGLAPGGTNAFGVNPRVSPFTGNAYDSHEGAYDRSGVIKVEGDGLYLTLNRDFGDLTLTSITSYLEGSFLNLVDADGSIADLLHIDFGSSTREIGQDLRLSSDYDGPFNFIAGLYYFNDDIDVQTIYRLFAGAAVLDQTYQQERESYAAYFDGTFDLSDQATIYGGLRWTDDTGTMTNFTVVPTIPTQPTIGYDDSDPSGRIGFRYRFNPDLMGYVQYARGYRSSAINGGALTNPADLSVAAPEHLDSYEAGVKAQFDGLRINASFFHYDFADQQFLNLVGIGNQQLVNAGKSRIDGAEIELAASLTENFDVSMGVGLLSTEYEELVLNGTDLSGNELIEAPSLTANFAADYTIPLGDSSNLVFHLDGAYVGDQYFSAFNDAPPYNRSKSDEFWDFNGRVSYRPANSNFEFALWGKNLSDNDEITGAAIDQTTATLFTTVPMPRRFGVEVRVDF